MVNMISGFQVEYALLSVFCFIASGQCQCPSDDTSWGSCSGANQQINIDWANYPSAACQEVSIVIPENYVDDTCTWTISLMNLQSVTPGITVYVSRSGGADDGDTITVTTSRNGGSGNLEFRGNLATLTSNANAASIEPRVSGDGEVDEVVIEFTTDNDGDTIFAGFTFRVVMYAIDEASACGTPGSPLELTLSTDYPSAALATPGFPIAYPSGASCYTFVTSPSESQIRVDYISNDLRGLEDYVIIYDSTDRADPILLRAQATSRLRSVALEGRSFDSGTNNLHISFQDLGANGEDFGVLLVFTLMSELAERKDCQVCDCSSVPSADDAECGISGGFAPISGSPEDDMCGTTINLDWTEADSVAYLATPGYNSGGYTDTDACQWTIQGPEFSNLVVIFRDFQLGDRDHVTINPGAAVSRTIRITGALTSLPFSDGSSPTAQNLAVVGTEIPIPRNALQMSLGVQTSSSNQGFSFEVRLVDNRCVDTCLNGGQCGSCTCGSGFFGTSCNRRILITLSVSPTTVTEGSSFTVTCTAEMALSEETRVGLLVDTSSTATEGSEYDFVMVEPYPCIIPAGNTVGTAVITTIDDLVMENPETVILYASNSVIGGAVSTAADDSPPITVTINDTPDTTLVSIDFSSSVYEVNEDVADGMLTVTVVFNYLGTPHPIPESGTIAIGYTATSATSSVDFMGSVTSVTFTQSTSTFPVRTTVDFNIPIINDEMEEPLEEFEIVLMSVSSLIVGIGTSTPTATVRIIDNDCPDNVIIIDRPELARDSNANVNIFYYSFEDLRVRWRKIDSEKPFTTQLDLVLGGSTHGVNYTHQPTTRLPVRRLGHFQYIIGLRSQTIIDAFITPEFDCLDVSYTTITVYPDPLDSTMLSSPLTLSVSTTSSCTGNIVFEKDGVDVPNRGEPTYTVSTTQDASGTFTIHRGNKASGFFVMIQVIVSECPFGTYKDNIGDCTQTCPTCQNGGVCELDGTCRCPPCFSGETCEIAYPDTFGKNQRYACADLHSSNSRVNCEGLRFCYGGLYGCSCGCGWMGQNCDQACGSLKYGADCKMDCDCSGGTCDPFTGTCD